MHLINSTDATLKFTYGRQSVVLESGELFYFDAFDLNKLTHIQELIQNGFLTLFDEDDDEGVIPFDLAHNRENSKKRIIRDNSVFDNVNFEDDFGKM